MQILNNVLSTAKSISSWGTTLYAIYAIKVDLHLKMGTASRIMMFTVKVLTVMMYHCVRISTGVGFAYSLLIGLNGIITGRRRRGRAHIIILYQILQLS